MRRLLAVTMTAFLMLSFGCVRTKVKNDIQENTQARTGEFEYFNDPALDPIKGKLRFFGSKPVIPPSDLARYPTPQEMAAIKVLKDKYEAILSAYIDAKNKYGGTLNSKGEDAMFTRSMLVLLIEGNISMNRYNEFKFNNDIRSAITREETNSVEVVQQQQSNGDGARQFLRVLGAGLYATGKYFESEQARRDAYRNSHPNFTCHRHGDFIDCNSY